MEYELNYCRECIQMTNHFNGECQKCRMKLRKVRITDFNKDMSEEERKYYGEEFDERR